MCIFFNSVSRFHNEMTWENMIKLYRYVREECFMDYMKNFIEYVGVRNLIIFGTILVALIIFTIVYHSIKLKIYRQEILDLQNQINGIKTLPLQYRLGRVQSIAKNMPEVAEEYEQFTKDFEKITEFQKNELGVLVNEVDEFLFYGKPMA